MTPLLARYKLSLALLKKTAASSLIIAVGVFDACGILQNFFNFAAFFFTVCTRKGSFLLRAWNGGFFLLLIFPRLKSTRALSKAKKSIKQTKNAPFHARGANEPLKA